MCTRQAWRLVVETGRLGTVIHVSVALSMDSLVPRSSCRGMVELLPSLAPGHYISVCPLMESYLMKAPAAKETPVFARDRLAESSQNSISAFLFRLIELLIR